MIGASFSIPNKPLSSIPEFTLIRGLRVGPSITPGWGLVARGTNQVIRGLEFSALHTDLPEGKRG